MSSASCCRLLARSGAAHRGDAAPGDPRLPLHLAGRRARPSASASASSRSPATRPTVANVLSAADVACYSAKDLGRDRVQVYKPDDVPERHREMHWVAKLSRACDEGASSCSISRSCRSADRADREHFELHAAAARRIRRADRARGVHSGGGALQRDAVDRPLGRAPGARPARASQRLGRQALHHRDQPLRQPRSTTSASSSI
jgi:hypothetical protein